DDAYSRAVQAAAGEEVRFLGAVHDPVVVGSLRRHSRVYLHGHTVGGTNPSLVEAMAAGNAVIAHGNVYNRWVAGPDNDDFPTQDALARLLDRLVSDEDRRRTMGESSRARYR